MSVCKEELKSLLMEMKEESKKAVLKLNIQKIKIMTSSHSLHGKQIGKKWKQWQTLFSWAPKSPWMVTAVMKLKEALLLGRKAITNLDSMLKSRDITIPTKICIVQAMVFPVVMYGCESWTIKKTEHWRIDVF